MSKKRIVILSVFSLSSFLSVFDSQSAVASEPWSINVLTDLTKIDQFENRELSFRVTIKDKDIIQTLKNSGSELIGNVLLVPTKELKKENRTFSDGKPLYTCYNPKPSSLAGNTGGSALRPVKSGDEAILELTYKCWFPIGMKIDNYSLNISLMMHNNNVGTGYIQMFLFGNYPDSMRPTWMYQPTAGVVYSPARNVTVNNIQVFPIIEVIRSEPKTSPDALTFNSKNLVELTESLKKMTVINNSLYAKKNVEVKKINSEIKSSISQTKTLLSITQNKKNINSIIIILSNMNTELIKVKEITSAFTALKPGSLEYDIKRKYLFGLDFDVVSKPEILVAQYPDIKTLKSNPTPYLRFVIQSKTAITFSDIALLSPGIGGSFFAGNVALPGNSALNDQRGGGLALVENQQWDGSMFITSLLIGPKYTPVKDSDLSWAQSATCSTARFEDAAGNSSDLWLGSGKYAESRIPSQGCIPQPNQAISATTDFDNLVIVYNNLAEENENFQKSIVIPETVLSGLEKLSKISQNIKILKSSLAKLK
jgi:hypothetical protein